MMSVQQYVPEQIPRQGEEVLGRELHPEEVDRQAVQEGTLHRRILIMAQHFVQLCSRKHKEARRQGRMHQREAEQTPLDDDPGNRSP